MRKLFLLMSLLAIFAMLAACAPAAAPAAEKPAAAAKFKACLLAPGPVNDKGWNQIAYDALKQMEKELGAEIAYVELPSDPSAYEKTFRDFSAQGCKFILGHGNEFEDSAKVVSKEYPNVFYFISSSRMYAGNVIGLNTDASQGTYLFGIIAAKMGKGAGLVGGMEIPPIAETFTGFVNGAKSVDPNFKVNSMYLGNWTDAAGAKEAGIGFTKQGADFLVPNADFASSGVFQACVEANVNCFGLFGDNTAQAPKNVVANLTVNYGAGLVKIAKEVKEGTFKPTKNVEFGLKDTEVFAVIYNDKADKPVTAEVKKAVEEATKKIIAGEVNTLAK